MAETIIRMENVTKLYEMGESVVHALRGISFSIKQGEFVSIMGPSGSGKSTCMNMIGCLDRPTSGILEIGGKETAKMTEKELAALRNKTIGFVFQQYHLLPSMTILENVMLPLRYQGVERAKQIKLAKKTKRVYARRTVQFQSRAGRRDRHSDDASGKRAKACRQRHDRPSGTPHRNEKNRFGTIFLYQSKSEKAKRTGAFSIRTGFDVGFRRSIYDQSHLQRIRCGSRRVYASDHRY